MEKLVSNKYLHKFDFLWRLYAPAIGLLIWSTYLSREKYLEYFAMYWIGLIIFQLVVFLSYQSPKKSLWTVLNIIIPPLLIISGAIIYGIDEKLLFLGFGVIEIITVVMISFLFLITVVNKRLYAKTSIEKKAHTITNIIKLVFFGGFFLIILYTVLTDLVKASGQFLLFIMGASIYSAVMYFIRLDKVSFKNKSIKKLLIHLGITTITFWILFPNIMKLFNAYAW